MKVGIIGVGNIAQCHIHGYRQCPEVELYAFCDINEARLREQGAQHGVTRLYTDIDTMLRELPELDAVSVCTWNNGHAPCSVAALKAGKHVLCEKPMALNAAEAAAMLEAAKESGKTLQVGFVRRFDKSMEVLRSFVDNHYFGPFYYAKASYLRRHGNPGGWFADKSRSGGGPMIDLGVHVIDYVRYAMDCPKAVSVYGATFQKLLNRPDIKKDGAYLSVDAAEGDPCTVEDLATALIRFDNGAVLQIDASFSLNVKEDTTSIQLFGEKAGALIDPELTLCGQENGYLTDTTLVTKTALDFGQFFDRELRHFVDVVQGKATCIAPGEDGYELMRILDAVYESARTGHEVTL